MNAFYKRRAFAWFCVFLLAELFFVFFVDRPLAVFTRQLDTTHHGFIEFFRSITDVGLAGWYQWPSGIGALLCLGLYHAPRVSSAARSRILSVGQAFVYFFACTACSGLLTDFLKPLFGRARPKLLFSEEAYGFYPLTFDSARHSMPSGHSTTVISAALALAVLFPRARPALAVLAVIAAFSRIMVNAHYLSDVLAGAAIGLVVTWFLTRWFVKKGLLTAVFSSKAGEPSPADEACRNS